MAVNAYYFIGTMSQVYTKVYDGTKLQADVLTYEGYADTDSFQAQITDGNIKHVNQYGTMTYDETLGKNIGTLDLHYDEGYPKIFRGSTDVTTEYNQTQVADGTFEDLTPGYKTFTIISRDITLQSANLTKEYDGTALVGGGTVTDLTAGQTDKGYVSGEEFAYTFTGSQLFVGSSDNSFNVSDSATALTSDYNVTKQYGTLTVTARTTPVTITVADQEWLYDGTTSQFDQYAYTVAGELAANDTITVTLVNGGQVDAGTYADGITATYQIMHNNGDGTYTDVTSMYSGVEVIEGDLKIDQRSITLTSATDSKSYDGTPLTNSKVTVTGDGFVGSEGATYDVTGSQTEVGTSKNTFTYTLNSNTKAGNYDITTVEGDLTVTPQELVITVGTSLTTGLTYLYDNTSTKVLEAGEYQVSGLAAGDNVVNVTITTNSANAGIYDEDAYTLSYDVVNAAGESTKASYIITENKNDVEITKRTITIAADSASKVYDGTALTCHTYTVEEGATEEYQLLDGENVEGVGFTADSTITHAGSTANKVDASNVTITKADGSDSSMNYNILTEDGTLTVTQRGVLLQSTSADKYYDGTALQNRQVIITGFAYDENGNVVVDTEDAGFLDGDGCTYDFRNDNVVIDKDGNIIAWVVSEQSNTAYGQTEVGTSKNEFDYNNFTSVYYGSFESDYIIMYGDNQESLGLGKDEQDLYGDLTVWGGPVEINMTDYSWTYDYQAKTNGYFDDGYTVVVTTDEAGTEEGKVTTEVAHNSEGSAIALLGSDTIVVNVTGEGGSAETGKVQHVDDGEGASENKQNTATYTIYRNGVDVTSEIEEYYQISVDGGELKITPRTVEIASASDSKRYDGTELTNNTIIEGSEGTDKGFIFGEGAAYEVSGSQTDIGTSDNTFAISELLTDTRATDYNFVMTEGKLTVTGGPVTDYNYSDKSDIIQFVNGLVYVTYDNGEGVYEQTGAIADITEGGWNVVEMRRDLTGDGLADVQITTDVDDETCVATLRNDYLENGAITLSYKFIGTYDNTIWTYMGSADINADGKSEVLMMQTDEGLDENGHRNVAAWTTDENGEWSGNEWVGALVSDEWSVAGTADVTGDGQDNVILRRYDGMLGYWNEVDFETNPDIVEIADSGDNVLQNTGDFDGDGADDFLLTNAQGDITLWTDIDDGLVSECIGNVNEVEGWDLVGAGDYNGDGKEEFLWCNGINSAYSEATQENYKNLIQIA